MDRPVRGALAFRESVIVDAAGTGTGGGEDEGMSLLARRHAIDAREKPRDPPAGNKEERGLEHQFSPFAHKRSRLALDDAVTGGERISSKSLRSR
jgi:hypothetical protein